jgi:hypothetical protein
MGLLEGFWNHCVGNQGENSACGNSSCGGNNFFR